MWKLLGGGKEGVIPGRERKLDGGGLVDCREAKGEGEEDDDDSGGGHYQHSFKRKGEAGRGGVVKGFVGGLEVMGRKEGVGDGDGEDLGEVIPRESIL